MTKRLGAKKRAKQIIERGDWQTVMQLLIHNRNYEHGKEMMRRAATNLEHRFAEVKAHESFHNHIKDAICRRYGPDVYMDMVAEAAQAKTNEVIAKEKR